MILKNWKVLGVVALSLILSPAQQICKGQSGPGLLKADGTAPPPRPIPWSIVDAGYSDLLSS